ncbi:MAG: ABC transporter substrate-binding protein [Blastochloris sp.]|nr:ABC transporter substrate-binding protein [Blastochloris sp.]
MSFRFRAIAACIVLAIFTSLIAACGTTGGANPDGAAAPVEGSTAAPAEDGAAAPAGGNAATQAGACPAEAAGQTVTLWSPLTGPDGQFMTQLAQQFNEQNGQNIQVNHVPQPDYVQKLNTAAAGGNLPEMTVVRADDIAEMVVRNVLKPISTEAQAILGDDVAGQFPEQVWNVGSIEGNRYTIPLDVHPLVLYYNKDMFEAAGIEGPPTTREEFDAAAETLNQNGVRGVAIGTAFQAGTLFWTLLRQFGGNAFSEGGTEATFNSPEGVEALTYLRDLKEKYSPEVSGAGDPEVTLFTQGQAAMVIHGPWHISNLQQLPFTGFAPVPQWGDEFAVWGGSHQLGFTTDDAAKQAAAACWTSWLSENSVQWAAAGQVPARESARTTGELEQVAAPVASFAAEIEGVIMPEPVPGLVPAVWGEGFGRAVDAVLLGEASDIQVALDEAAARSNQIIEQNLQRYGQ